MRWLGQLGAIGTLVATAVGCGGGASPQFDRIDDQTVQVGTELVVQLLATDEDGDELHFGYDTDVPDIQSRASISKTPSGAGVFRWTPLAGDVGLWYFDFTVTDGSNRETVTIQIDVRSAVGQNGAPVFREPLGTGTTLDLRSDDCLEINVVVEDQDSSSVMIAQEEPVIEGATLQMTTGLGARWSWCPSEQQIAADDRYMLVLSADDLSNPKTVKHYLVVLRRETKPDCPGDPPVVTHTPSDESTLTGLTLAADITDDLGLKAEPLLYYSLTAPASPVDLGSMTQVTMVLIDGTMQDGLWAADVPNPVVSMPQGSQADVHYVIVATDNDDTTGSCDHVTQDPDPGAFTMTVTNPGGDGGAGLCEACTADVQCGGSADLCVRVGTQNEPFCLQSCTVAADCPTDYSCSSTTLTSIDGNSGKQCVPNSNSCSDPGGTVCNDDTWEDNDSRTQAGFNPYLTTGTHSSLVSCPATSGDDEDWFEITLSGDHDVTLTLAATSDSDLDLALYDSTGTYITSSNTLTSNESIQRCLAAGSYFVRAYAWSPVVENPYTLTYERTAGDCGGTASCDDDAAEDDDIHTQARAADIYPDPYLSDTNAICADDDDWFEIEIFDGETVHVDLTFDQADSKEDLDLHFFDDVPTDLTPCSEADPFSCSATQGQSATSNEHYEYTVADPSCLPCVYYVVVRGWSGSENLYDLRIGLTPQ